MNVFQYADSPLGKQILLSGDVPAMMVVHVPPGTPDDQSDEQLVRGLLNRFRQTVQSSPGFSMVTEPANNLALVEIVKKSDVFTRLKAGERIAESEVAEIVRAS